MKTRRGIPQRARSNALANSAALMLCAECGETWTTRAQEKVCPSCGSADIGRQMPLEGKAQ